MITSVDVTGRPVLLELERHTVVPVVEVDDAARAVPLARALVEGGLPVMEVAFGSPAGPEAVAAVSAELPEVLVGAGGLLTPAMVLRAAASGARFGVCPGVSEAVLQAAASVGLPFLPGAVTPSELMTCLDAGATHVTFLPAGGQGGPPALAALATAFSSTGVRFVPTGGVTGANAPQYLAIPQVAAVGGTWVAPREDVVRGRWDDVRDRARAVAALRVEAGEGG